MITFAVLLLFPIGAWAASSGVFITDPTGARKADVTTAGKLKVDTGLSSFGIVPTVVQGGSVNVVSPTGAIFHGVPVEPQPCSGTTCAILAKPPAGKALVITSTHIGTFQDTNPGFSAYFTFTLSSNGTCASGTLGTALEFVTPAGLGEIVLPFEPGLGIPAGKALCAVGSTDLGADITAWGYTVASGAVPNTAAAGPKLQAGKKMLP